MAVCALADVVELLGSEPYVIDPFPRVIRLNTIRFAFSNNTRTRWSDSSHDIRHVAVHDSFTNDSIQTAD